jgi:hypothetical protein
MMEVEMSEQLDATKVTATWKSHNPLICIGVGTGAHLRQEEMESCGHCMVVIASDCLQMIFDRAASERLRAQLTAFLGRFMEEAGAGNDDDNGADNGSRKN